MDRYGLAKERKLGYYEAASNTHFLKQLDKVSDGISPGQLVGCKDCLRRTAGQPEKKVNYVCNATIGEYVEVPQVPLFSTELYFHIFGTAPS